MNDKGFFYADYGVGKVTVASKTVDAGQYTVELLNQYYKDDTAARISVFRAENWELEDTLSKGYLNPRLFVEAVTVINNIFTALPKLKPFNLIDIDKEKERIAKLFTYENAEILDEYFRRKGKLQNIKEEYIILGIVPPEYDKDFFTMAEKLLNEVNTTLGFYDNLGDDITLAFNKLKRFVSRLGELEKFSKENLSQLATDIFGEKVIPVNTEYTSDSLVARRLYFNSFYSFMNAVTTIDGIKWYFSNKAFVEFVETLECESSWQYTGESELLLIPYHNKTLDFSEVGLFHLDKMLTDNTISSISSFITRLNRLLKNNRSTLLVSLQEGTKCLVETFIKEIINQLPTYISKPLKSGRHYLCQDFSKYI